MELICGEKGKMHLPTLCRRALVNCDEVWAAIAYVSCDKELLKPCFDNKIQLKLWARYDHTLPVKPEILRWFLGKSPLMTCRLVPDILHSKVIWWRPYGVYIGSANLTHRAWFSNFETGVFLQTDELEEGGQMDRLEAFFADVNDSSRPLTEELVNELEEHRQTSAYAAQFDLQKVFEATRSLPKISSISDVTKEKNASKKRRDRFLKEWYRTLQSLRDIGQRLARDENRPSWIPDNTPEGVQADQFLHAYYYRIVMEGHRARHHELHEENRTNPERALKSAMSWWEALDGPPSSELETINAVPKIVRATSRNKILTLDKEEFIDLMAKIHAFWEYAKQASYTSLGLSERPQTMSAQERSRFLASRIFDDTNANGETILEVLHFLLHGGPVDEVPHRLFELRSDPSRRIRHIGLSTLGELVGWALPIDFPPRNGRTSKGLYALGYDVKIHTE